MREERFVLLMLMLLVQRSKRVKVLSDLISHGIHIAMDWVVGIGDDGQEVGREVITPLMTFGQAIEHCLILGVQSFVGLFRVRESDRHILEIVFEHVQPRLHWVLHWLHWCARWLRRGNFWSR